jgi:hypothetical protein
MRLAIMQPYFFPYLGYFTLIKHSDLFIVFDTVQFIRHGWIDRNRILKPQEGWQYIKVPIRKYSRSTLINNIEIKNDLKWKEKIIAQLSHYKKKAPYFNRVIELISEIFSNNYNSIGELNLASLSHVCNYLEIDTPIQLLSRMELNIREADAPDEWALNICKAIDGTTEYWNPPGGIGFFDTEKYKNHSLKLRFCQTSLTQYNQFRQNFEAGLSIIDVMMFNSPKEIYKMLDDFQLK